MANKTSARADQKTSTKIYTVVKDGLELDQLKTLAAAKKLADTEGAEVFCDGKCVYPGAVNAAAVNPGAVNLAAESGMEMDELLGDTAADGASTDEAATDVTTTDEAATDTPVDAQLGLVGKKGPAPDAPHRYRLKSLMNVRDRPSLNGRILATKPEGTVVSVQSVDNGWLHLTDGRYILYAGVFAEEI